MARILQFTQNATVLDVTPPTVTITYNTPVSEDADAQFTHYMATHGFDLIDEEYNVFTTERTLRFGPPPTKPEDNEQ